MSSKSADDRAESRDSSRKRVVVGAASAILAAAVVGAFGVWATIAIIDRFATDVVDDITCELDLTRPDPTVPSPPMDDIRRSFADDYFDGDVLGDGVHSIGNTHTTSGYTIVLRVSDPKRYDHLPGTYRGVNIEVCAGGPAVPLSMRTSGHG